MLIVKAFYCERAPIIWHHNFGKFLSYPTPRLCLCDLDRGGPTASWTGRTRWLPSMGSGRIVSSLQHGNVWSHPAFCNIRKAETHQLQQVIVSYMWEVFYFLYHHLYHLTQVDGQYTYPLCPWDNGLIHILQLFILCLLHSLRPHSTPVMNPTTPCSIQR